VSTCNHRGKDSLGVNLGRAAQKGVVNAVDDEDHGGVQVDAGEMTENEIEGAGV
jgi:hypothetical protein